MTEDSYLSLRQAMVQIVVAHVQATADTTGLSTFHARVLEAMLEVPRHEFVPTELRPYAHSDGPLPIGWDKTISQPFIAALMTELLDLRTGDSVLEIGTGLGYHAALLSRLAAQVYSVEIVEELADDAGERLKRLHYDNIRRRVGNGHNGWPEHAPYDRIIVAAAPELIPSALIAQLKPGGKMVLPAGLNEAQQLMVVSKDDKGKISTRDVLPVRFAPLEGTEI